MNRSVPDSEDDEVDFEADARRSTGRFVGRAPARPPCGRRVRAALSRGMPRGSERKREGRCLLFEQSCCQLTRVCAGSEASSVDFEIESAAVDYDQTVEWKQQLDQAFRRRQGLCIVYGHGALRPRTLCATCKPVQLHTQHSVLT